MNAGEKFLINTDDLALGEYEYMCIVHPWMIATFVIEEPTEPVIETVSIPEGAGIQLPGQIYYDPDLVTVAIGTTVVWTNDDVAIHTVTATEGEFDSDIMSVRDTFEFTFNSEGSFDYFCIVHPWMEGTVSVG